MSTTTVECPAGPITGREKEGVLLFAGVPYAKPPVDELRFKAPEPLPPFAEPYEAFKFGPAAPQVPSGGLTDSAPVRWSEDCLTLNISTPACDSEGRAVLVWIHGGGYRTGQSSIPWYNGTSFANNDVVVETRNCLFWLWFSTSQHCTTGPFHMNGKRLSGVKNDLHCGNAVGAHPSQS